jgi:hypothetical protein
MKSKLFFAAAILLILAAGQALGMSSANYRLEWFTPLSGGGGGGGSSSQFAANFTIGQTVSGASASSGNQACLGYWCGALENDYYLYLPFVVKLNYLSR